MGESDDMQRNDNDDEKYENPDESEYHFSDDDVTFESDTEHHDDKVQPDAVPTMSSSDGSRSKRMLIGGVAFVALVLVIYKFVAPTSTVISTDIAAQPTVAQQAAPLQANVPSATAPAQQVAAAAPAAAPVAAPTPPPVEAIPSAAPTSAPVQAQAAPAPLPEAGTAAPQVASTSAAPAALPAPGSAAPMNMAATQPAPMPAPAGGSPMASLPAPIPPAPLGNQQPEASQPNASMAANNSNVIPMQSIDQAQSQADQTISSIVAPPPMAGGSDAKVAALEAQSVQLMGQLQASYSQKLNDFSEQNKTLQDQVQTLNARVSGLETDLNKMMQMMSQHNAPSAPAPAAAPSSSGNTSDMMSPQSSAQSSEFKSNYSVQAIIPGRAWLRSLNGETVTVAEGDIVHDLGRVTKVDPYDGVVEINTGNRVISLSYGNVG